MVEGESVAQLMPPRQGEAGAVGITPFLVLILREEPPGSELFLGGENTHLYHLTVAQTQAELHCYGHAQAEFDQCHRFIKYMVRDQ